MEQQAQRSASPGDPDDIINHFSPDGRMRPERFADSRDGADRTRVHIDPEPDLLARLQRVREARNPLLEAALPLLRVLSEMPEKLPGTDGVVDEFRGVLDREVRNFQTLCDKASLRREHVLTARYCLCTAIDEAASSMPWGAVASGRRAAWPSAFTKTSRAARSSSC